MTEHTFGLVGCGMIARFHALAIGAMESARLVGASSRSEANARKVADEFGGEAYTELDALLDRDDLETVIVTTPSGAHLDAAVAAARAGKNVLVEKPLEVTPARCDEIIEACEKHGVALGVVFQSRFHPVNRLVKRTIEAGRFGRLALAGAYVKWWRPQSYYDSGAWRGTWELDGGGALTNQSIHAIDLLLWFAGEVESVSARVDCLAHERIEVEDTGAAVLRFASGAIGVVEGSTAAFPGQLKRIELCGDKGSCVVAEEDLSLWSFSEESPEDEEIRKKFTSRSGGGGAADPAAIDFRAHERQLEDFCRALEEKRAPLVDGPEGRRSVALLAAIYESAKAGGKPIGL